MASSSSSPSPPLYKDYPWVAQSKVPVVGAPMMKISMGAYALATSSAGGIGFLAGGFDVAPLKQDLADAASLLKQGRYPGLSGYTDILPIGVGIQNWGTDKNLFLDALRAQPVRAVWFFAPKEIKDLGEWAEDVRKLDLNIKVWVQIGNVGQAVEAAKVARPDVIVVQGADAGGHGFAQRAGVITLLPEVADALEKEGFGSVPLIAAGGIVDGRTAAAALASGADGVCLGTRLLASYEAKIAKGYQNEVLRVSDGGVSTVASTVYDRVRGIHGWPKGYDGRGIINKSFIDAENGMPDEENEKLYETEMGKGDEGWGPNGRMTTYAGTGVGLVKEVMSIENIVKEVQENARARLSKTATRFQ